MDQDLKKNMISTGTSLVGIVCKDGIIMAGDRKSTAGGIAMRKDVLKVCPVNDYILISGTGLAADIEISKKIIKAQLKLKELGDKRRPSAKEAANLVAMLLYKNVRQPSMIPFMAGLMVGGLNEDGSAELYSVDPAGNVSLITDFDANFSSGMPYILGLLEKNYRSNITLEEGIELSIDCIKSASQRDTGSGFGVDVFTITKEGIKQVSKQRVESVYQEQD